MVFICNTQKSFFMFNRSLRRKSMAIVKIDTSTPEGQEAVMKLSAKIEQERKALKSINKTRLNLCVKHTSNLVKALQNKYQAKDITFEQLNETVSFTDQHGQTCTAHIVITTGAHSASNSAAPAAPKAPFSNVESAVFAHLATLDQKESMTKANFTKALEAVEGYQNHMWSELKDKLAKDPTSPSGRGTRFFPKAEG
jgi:hypothetical protein